MKYYTRITTIKQNDYLTIEEYWSEILDTCKKLEVCNKRTIQTQSSKIKEIFYSGLTKRTRI